jgi:hypothetical protein
MSTRTYRVRESGDEIFMGQMPSGKWARFGCNREYEAAYRKEKREDEADIVKAALFGAGCLLVQAVLCSALMV